MSKKRKTGSLFLRAARRLTALCATLYIAWALFLPQSSGAVGRLIENGLTGLFGLTAYLVPLALGYALVWYFRSQSSGGALMVGGGAALCLVSAATLLSALGKTLSRPLWGGSLGNFLADSGQSLVGLVGTYLAALALAFLGVHILFALPWGKLLSRGIRLLVEDYQAWRMHRRELKDWAAQTRKRLEDAQGEGAPRMAEIPALARNGASAEAADAPLLSVPAQIHHEAAKPKVKVKREDFSAPMPAADGSASFQLPPLDLLHPKKPGSHTGRPSDGEIQEAVASLERTLASFEIQARVSGISPGPVITRYEVSPAPGVTVNSIVARADDIALAMRAKGIRMIAPIPGKAAIGIEIPNHHPATVTLREVLESSALTSNRAPLAFALGLASDGSPLSADLQTMPHVLVAGATNSGKSVMVHSLIASILFKRRPDEVKLLLIDPKRIELSLYDGIPHLYDPKTPASQVTVLTMAKQAAASLKALVTVMERRYEKFQLYKVRDIVAYNREAFKRGEPGEFFIVVVIDELADLMVVARDVVEDSIQRLTQMARAVGIHLVLATQRPSVDVVTGVIKANLPSRVALRVASKVDSKVIIDGNGAEALLGKGDMLYLAPGQDPARIQGCFVSSTEISALVDYLKTQGKPDYPALETMGAVGEADLSQFGVEPLEFTQALKLVLQRRRVSQDLLKSQFGSSARATNILSLLEVKEFIHKPEGSNRWEIHFDKIENYLRTHYPQIPLDKPGI